MNGSTLTYEQINAASSNLNQYATEMQAILDEIVSYLSRIGNDDVWSGTAAMASKEKFNTLRTGRANAALLDRIECDYYGDKLPIKDISAISSPEPRQLIVKPYDKISVNNFDISHLIVNFDA